MFDFEAVLQCPVLLKSELFLAWLQRCQFFFIIVKFLTTLCCFNLDFMTNWVISKLSLGRSHINVHISLNFCIQTLIFSYTSRNIWILMMNYPKFSFYPYFYYFNMTFLKLSGPQKVNWVLHTSKKNKVPNFDWLLALLGANQNQRQICL